MSMAMQGRKAQIFPQIGIIFWFGLYFCFYFAALGGYLTTFGQMLAMGQSGFLAFFVYYLNVWFLIIPLLSFLVYMTLS